MTSPRRFEEATTLHSLVYETLVDTEFYFIIITYNSKLYCFNLNILLKNFKFLR